MIVWCSYCQSFLGEKTPFDVPNSSHGICGACDARLEQGEPLKQHTEAVRQLMRKLTSSATAGDETACASFIEQTRLHGLNDESILVGLLQPALYQAGIDWQGTRMSVATEHRFTRWCERVFAMLPANAIGVAPIDLLILQTPGNSHTVGPRFAAHILAKRGFAVEIVEPAIPFEEMVTLAQMYRPRVIGMSCALPATVSVASDLLVRLRARLEPRQQCRFIISGYAMRQQEGPPFVDPGIEIVTDLNFL